MTPPWLCEIAERIEKASKGPWVVRVDNSGECGVYHESPDHALATIARGVVCPADAAFMAHARMDVAKLLTRLIELEADTPLDAPPPAG